MILLLGLLAFLALPLRAAYDPFAPSAPGFPERRLRRAGVDDATVTRLREQYAGMDPSEQREFNRTVTRNPDRRILSLFQGRRTREELEHMTVDDDLIPLLRERGLSLSGRKAELIDRLLESYEAGNAPSAPESPAAPPAGPDTPDTTPEAGSGEQRPAEAAPTPVTGTVTPATPATTAAPAATPTPAATPAPDAAPAATTTTEERTRG